MTEVDWPAAFEQQRPHLRAVAYRMLGSTGEADDAVQEAWLRLDRSDASEIDNLGAWLTTVVARIALNMLRSRGTRREQPLEALPDPIVDPIDGTDPEHEALLADSVGLALLIVLETLGPAERLAFVLHDMFGVPFDEIGPIVDRSPTRLASWRAGEDDGCGRRTPSPTPTSAPSASWSRPSWRPPAKATSTGSSRCSIPTSSCAPTSARRAASTRCMASRRRWNGRVPTRASPPTPT